MTAQKASFFLSTTERLQSLTQTVGRLLEVQKVYLGLAAPKSLAEFSKVGALEHGTLILLAENGAIAAKLRQQLPTLLSKFQQRGVQVNAIRVEVQAGIRREEARPLYDKRIDETGLESLQKLQNRLEDGPLKGALAKLLAHQNRR
jgi:hypothetical protein